jgi:hypothetical protein
MPLGTFNQMFINNDNFNCRCRIDLRISEKSLGECTAKIFHVLKKFKYQERMRAARESCALYFDLGFINIQNCEN